MQRIGRAAHALGVTAATLVAFLAVLAGPLGAQGAGDDAPPLELFHGLTLVDGRGGPALPDAAIVLRGSEIVFVGPRAEVEARWASEAGTVSVDLGGAWVVPGLIDAHIHLATVPNRARAEQELHRLLYAGVTSVRDMAGDARALASLARDTRLGEIEGPDVYFSALMAGPSFFDDPRPQASAQGETAGEVPWLQAISEETDLAQAVALARGTSAKGIKIYANLDAELVRGIVYEAHSLGMPVWAHSAVFPTRPVEVVRSGVDVISHVCRLAWEAMAKVPRVYHHGTRPEYESFTPDAPVFTELFDEMLNRGTILDATLAVDTESAPRECNADFSRALVRSAHAAGVAIAAGSDFVTPPEEPFPSLHRELEELVLHGGLSPMDAIVAATSTAARAIGIDRTVGTLAPGKRADFVVLDADPTANVHNLQQIREVWKNGKRFQTTDR